MPRPGQFAASRTTPAGTTASLLVSPRLGAHAGAWDELVALLPVPSPFLRSWWLEAMAENVDACFLLVFSDGKLIGGLALERTRSRGMPTLGVLGSGPLCPDHLDLLAAPGREADVGAAVAEWLRGRGTRLVDLRGVAEHHRLGPVLGGSPVVTLEEEAPFVRLPPDFAGYLEMLPPIMRNSIRRSGNKLGRRGEVAFRVVEPEQLDASLSRLRTLHTGQFGVQSGLIREFDRFSAAARAGHRRQELRLFELWVGEDVAAVDVVFTVAGRMSYYQGGRQLQEAYSGAGTVVMARGFAWACEQGMSEVDFLRGTEPYKLQWARQRRRLLRLRLGVGAPARAALFASRLRQAPRVRAAVGRVRGAVATTLHRFPRGSGAVAE